MTDFGPSQLLAEGALNWTSAERVTDRYGAIHIQTAGAVETTLEESGADPEEEYADFEEAPVGMMGRLVVEVTEARESHHDYEQVLAGRTQSSPPAVGERIVLGEGELFLETDARRDVTSIGVRPEDASRTPWMDADSLRRAHYQTVRLYFEPAKVPGVEDERSPEDMQVNVRIHPGNVDLVPGNPEYEEMKDKIVPPKAEKYAQHLRETGWADERGLPEGEERERRITEAANRLANRDFNLAGLLGGWGLGTENAEGVVYWGFTINYELDETLEPGDFVIKDDEQTFEEVFHQLQVLSERGLSQPDESE